MGVATASNATPATMAANIKKLGYYAQKVVVSLSGVGSAGGTTINFSVYDASNNVMCSVTTRNLDSGTNSNAASFKNGNGVTVTMGIKGYGSAGGTTISLVAQNAAGTTLSSQSTTNSNASNTLEYTF